MQNLVVVSQYTVCVHAGGRKILETLGSDAFFRWIHASLPLGQTTQV